MYFTYGYQVRYFYKYVRGITMFDSSVATEEPLESVKPAQKVLTEEEYSNLDYEQKLAYTQNLKQKILVKLVDSGNGIPTDKESVETILKVAESLDKVTIQDRRLNIETTNAKSNQDIADGFAAFVKQMQSNNPLWKPPAEDAEGKDVSPPVDIEKIGEWEHAKGEDEIGIVAEDSNSFMARMEALRNKD